MDQPLEHLVDFLRVFYFRTWILHGKRFLRDKLFFRGEMELPILVHQHFQKLFHDMIVLPGRHRWRSQCKDREYFHDWAPKTVMRISHFKSLSIKCLERNNEILVI